MSRKSSKTKSAAFSATSVLILIAVSVGVVLATLHWHQVRWHQVRWLQVRTTAGEASQEATTGTNKTSLVPFTDAKSAPEPVNTSAASRSIASLPAKVLAAPQVAKVNFALASASLDGQKRAWVDQRLQAYRKIKSKVFMSSQERGMHVQLLEDQELLKSLAAILSEPAYDAELRREQDQAVDLLLEARSETRSELAGQVLRAVIADARIEDRSLDQKSRQALSERKAEVIYQWTAQEPEREQDLPGWLPGPVSQKIWNNVQDAQKQNVVESEVLQRERATR